MGKVTIQVDTEVYPISLIGREAGVCWNGDTKTPSANYKRGIECINNNHGRTLEFPQIYMVLDGYSARVIREFYTHIAGSPTRLQSSTRYIDYENFEYVMPPKVENNGQAKYIYDITMKNIASALKTLEDMGVPREDASMLLPLGMTTKVVVRTNLRHLIDMSRQRMCNRAYWEYRVLMRDIIKALKEYSTEWETLITELNVFNPKCDEYGHCTESKSCGRYDTDK